MNQIMNNVRHLTAAVAIGGCILVAGCGGNSAIAGLSNEALQDKAYECDREAQPSPGFAIACDNYRRECKTRSAEGAFVC